MKALIQRVTSASVSVSGEEVGRIGSGLCVYSEKDAEYLVQKTIGLRIFADESGKFNNSLLDIKGELLLVSQFTLIADTKKGKRPSFTGAAPPDEAERLFNEFVRRSKDSGLKVAIGRFQQYMQVEIHNDGPVTIMLDSRDKVL